MPSPFEFYRQSRVRTFTRLGELRERMDEWLQRFEDSEPSMSALAELEAIGAERLRAVNELQEAEGRLIEYFLGARQAQHRQAAPPPEIET